MSNGLLTVLTMRSASERLPGKCLVEITSRNKEGKKETQPLAVWIIRRLRQMDTALVVATTNEDSDNDLAKLCKTQGVEVIRGSTDDVIDRMDLVLRTGQYPGNSTIFRALGDCPFISTRLVSYAAKRLDQTGKDAFVYALDPERWPVYSAREFPYSMRAFAKIVKESPFREHPDQYFHYNRRNFQVLYHLPVESIYFRPYRLEVDWEEDIRLVQAVADGVGMLSSLQSVISFLDTHPDIARLNSDRIEKTGPMSLNSYSNAKRREWLLAMQGKEIMTFSGEILKPPDRQSSPIFCKCGHLIGWGTLGRLHTRNGSIIDVGFPKCDNCGLFVRHWQKTLPRAGAAL